MKKVLTLFKRGAIIRAIIKQECCSFKVYDIPLKFILLQVKKKSQGRVTLAKTSLKPRKQKEVKMIIKVLTLLLIIIEAIIDIITLFKSS